MAATMFSSDSDPTRKDSDLLPPLSILATFPPPPGMTEHPPTELKNSEVPLASPSAQYAPARSTESKDGELEEGEVVETPPAANYPPRVSSVERQDEVILPNTLTTQHVPSATTEVEAGKLQEEDIPPTTSTVHYPLIPSIEIDDDGIFSSSMTTHHARLHANPPRHRDWQDQAQHIRSQNPSPEPTTMQLEPVDNTPRPRPDKPSRKRKWPADAGPPAGLTPPPKKQKTSAGEDKKDNKFCWEVGQEFLGFVFHVDGEIAKEIARSIHKLPVPTEVHKRLIYFCDASIRSGCGTAGVVWQENVGSSNWKGTGFHYPESTVSTATVELFAISCTMQMAIGDINTERGTVVPNKPVDTALFQQHSAHTLSHLHNLTKEVFIFTDDCNALRRIDGLLAYDPNGDMGRQVEAISTHSKTLSDLGVHVELHLSPGHSAVPGNVAADRVAKRTAGITMASEAEDELILPGTASGKVNE